MQHVVNLILSIYGNISMNVEPSKRTINLHKRVGCHSEDHLHQQCALIQKII